MGLILLHQLRDNLRSLRFQTGLAVLLLLFLANGVIYTCRLERLIREDATIVAGDQGERDARAPYDTITELLSLEEAERRCLLAALEATNWVVAGPQGAVTILKAKPSTVRDRIAKHGLQRQKE